MGLYVNEMYVNIDFISLVFCSRRLVIYATGDEDKRLLGLHKQILTDCDQKITGRYSVKHLKVVLIMLPKWNLIIDTAVVHSGEFVDLFYHDVSTKTL